MNLEILQKHNNKISQNERKELGILHKCKKEEIIEKIYQMLLKENSQDDVFRIMIKYMTDKSFNKFVYSKNIETFGISPYHYFSNNYRFCKTCGKITTNSEFCSNKCSNNNEKTKNKIRVSLQKTLDKKYNGIKSTSQIPETRLKSKETCFKKYGVIGQYHGDQEKRKQTCLEKYGNKNYNNSEKLKKTVYLSKGLTITEINERIRNLNKEYCLRNFIKEGKFDLDKFKDYFKFSYSYAILLKHKLEIDLENWGHFIKGHSKAELELFEWIPLDNKILGDRTLITPYEIDILLPDLKLAIEYNGAYWHSFYPLSYHLNKLNMCIDKGFELWYIYDYDDINFWKQRLLDRINNVERKFDLQGLIDRRLYNKEELKNSIIQILDPTEEYVLGRFLC